MNVDDMVKINPDGSATHNGVDATDSGQGNDQTEMARVDCTNGWWS